MVASGDAFRLSGVSFQRGAASYLDVLDSQRQLSTAQQTLIGTRLANVSNAVTLYQVLSGGGSDEPPGAAGSE